MENTPLSIQKNKPLKHLSTLGIGGPAQYFVEVTTVEEMQALLPWCHKKNLRTMIIGKGSNCLFDDRGFKGIVIHNKIAFCEQPSPTTFHVGAGYSFSLLGTQTARKGLSGLEFASGIPGTVGGAVFMNAGANGSETCDTLVSVDYIDMKGERQLLNKENLRFRYRYSPFHERAGAIVGATFALTPQPEARQKQIDIITYRKKTQPYGDKSVGCIFRNPDCGHAGALIERSGLKGTHIGGAHVSTLHANFIVNTANATSQDVHALIQLIQQQVKAKHGAHLDSEVRTIPYEELP